MKKILVHVIPITLRPTKIEREPPPTKIFSGQYTNCAYVDDSPEIVRLPHSQPFIPEPATSPDPSSGLPLETIREYHSGVEIGKTHKA